MNFVLRLLMSAAAAILASYLIPGVHIEGITVAILLAVLLALLNVTVKPLLIIFTIPLTVFTLGLFLLVINALIILLADSIIPGFEVDGFWWAVLFSLVLSLINSLLTDLSGINNKSQK